MTPAPAIPPDSFRQPLKFADAGRTDLADLVDLERYPIHNPDSAAWTDLIARVKADLDRDGCSVLPAFLTEAGLAQAKQETNALAPKAFFQHLRCNIYNTEPDDSLADDDPRQLFFERSSGFVTRDTIPADTALQRIYVSPGMKRFVAECNDQPEVFEYADPFAGLVINTMPPGTQQPWHYDTNEFITTIMTQAPDDGGVFQYCPNIRTPGNENLDGVGRVLRGDDTSPINELRLRPGDLQMFRGRYSLHQVSRVRGDTARLTAVLAYAKKPGVVGPVERTRQLYGRVSEAHILAERARADSYDGLIR